MPYASFDDLRSYSSLRIMQDADDDKLATWSAIAQGEIDQFCSRDFVFEAAVPKSFWVTGPLIVLSKEVSSITYAETADQHGNVEGPINVSTEFLVIPPGNRTIRFQRMTNATQPYPIPPKLVTITADWGLDPIPDDVVRVFKRIVERVGVRYHEDDIQQQHFPYAKQSDGDGYDYDLGNATLRNLLRPEDRAQLWKWVSHGRISA